MKRTSLFLDEKLMAQLQRHARRHGQSFASVVREALVQYVAEPKVSQVPSIAGRFSSGKADTSERVDDLLWRDPHE